MLSPGRFLRRVHADEGGQMAVGMVLAFLLAFMVAAMTLDAGVWYTDHRKAVNQAEAAAQSAAIQLPANDTTVATSTVNFALTHNGASLSDLVTCPGGGSPKYEDKHGGSDGGGDGVMDTVTVCLRRESPAFFSKLVGIGSAYVSASVTAEVGTTASSVPLDVVLVMDRTASMSSSDMTAAKNAAKAVLGIFNNELQHAALATLGPSRTDSLCTGASSGAPGKAASSLAQSISWIPVTMTDDYKSGSSLNSSSLLVQTINCLDNPGGVGTNIGEPTRKAIDYLASGASEVRDDVKQGFIIFTDGATTENDGDTGFLSCGANAAVTSSAGDNNGFQTAGSGACTSGGTVAVDTNSGTGTSTSCTNSGKDKHVFSSYGVSAPTDMSVTAVQVRLDAKVDNTSGNPKMCVELSWNGGSSWTGALQTSNLTTSQATYVLGSSTSNSWSGNSSWSTSELNNSNFRVRVTNVDDNSSGSRDYSLDWVGVRVYFEDPIGPCHYAAAQADAAKAAGIEVFTIAYGDALTGETCSDSTGTWNNQLGTKLLAYMATSSTDDGGGAGAGCNTSAERTGENNDGDHFLCAASTTELTTVFVAAATTLSGGIAITR